LFCLPLLLLGASCGGGTGLKGRAENPCLQSLPACPNIRAACVLDPFSYGRARLPGGFNFIVDLEAGNKLTVLMFFAEERSPGLDTQILWHEPGCNLPPKEYRSEGLNLFDASEGGGVFSETRTLTRDGEHLIEIVSDMQAEVLVTVELPQP